MRRAAPLILLGFVAIVAAVGRIYYVRLKQQAAISGSSAATRSSLDDFFWPF